MQGGLSPEAELESDLRMSRDPLTTGSMRGIARAWYNHPQKHPAHSHPLQLFPLIVKMIDQLMYLVTPKWDASADAFLQYG